MKKNTLALISAASLTLVLAACGGGGGSDDSGPVPSAWNGTYLTSSPCDYVYDSTDGSRYYENDEAQTVNSSSATFTIKTVLYNDAQCSSKAGALILTIDGSQLKPTTLSGYQHARTGPVTFSDVTLTADGNGTGVSMSTLPVPKGAQTNFSGGINAAGLFCGTSSDGDLSVTPDMAEAHCDAKQP